MTLNAIEYRTYFKFLLNVLIFPGENFSVPPMPRLISKFTKNVV